MTIDNTRLIHPQQDFFNSKVANNTAIFNIITSFLSNQELDNLLKTSKAVNQAVLKGRIKEKFDEYLKFLNSIKENVEKLREQARAANDVETSRRYLEIITFLEEQQGQLRFTLSTHLNAEIKVTLVKASEDLLRLRDELVYRLAFLPSKDIDLILKTKKSLVLAPFKELKPMIDFQKQVNRYTKGNPLLQKEEPSLSKEIKVEETNIVWNGKIELNIDMMVRDDDFIFSRLIDIYNSNPIYKQAVIDFLRDFLTRNLNSKTVDLYIQHVRKYSNEFGYSLYFPIIAYLIDSSDQEVILTKNFKALSLAREIPINDPTRINIFELLAFNSLRIYRIDDIYDLLIAEKDLMEVQLTESEKRFYLDDTRKKIGIHQGKFEIGLQALKELPLISANLKTLILEIFQNLIAAAMSGNDEFSRVPNISKLYNAIIDPAFKDEIKAFLNSKLDENSIK